MSTPKREDVVPKPRRVPEKRPGQVGGKRHENRKKRVRELCSASLNLMLKKGIESVTVDEIVQEANVAKGSFYRYFSSKAELMESMFEPVRGHVISAFVDGEAAIEAAQSQEALLAAYAGISKKLTGTLLVCPREILLYLQECRAPRIESRESVCALAEDVAHWSVKLTEVARERDLLALADPRISALAVIGAAERLLFEVLSGGHLGVPPMQAADMLVQIVMGGLRSEVA